MKEYQFLIKYRGVPSLGISGATDHATLRLESGDHERPEHEFISDLTAGLKNSFSNAEQVIFQGATR